MASQCKEIPTHIWISGVFGPAINGHHDPLTRECGGLSRFDANTWDPAVRRGEKMTGRLNEKMTEKTPSVLITRDMRLSVDIT